MQRTATYPTLSAAFFPKETLLRQALLAIAQMISKRLDSDSVPSAPWSLPPWAHAGPSLGLWRPFLGLIPEGRAKRVAAHLRLVCKSQVWYNKFS